MKNYDKFYQGNTISKKVQNGFDDTLNLDVHSEIGSAKPQLALSEASGGIVDKPCYSAVVPNGDTYFFSKTDGAIFKRTQTGVYSSVRTNSNGGHKGARYYRGYLFYNTDTKLGRFDLGSAWNDNFQTLTSGGHAMLAFDLILYIANDNDIAQFDDADVFSESGLDLPTDQDISALKEFGDDLLAIANPGNYLDDSKIFRWDTFSSSWKIADAIKGVVPYAFLDADNYTYIVCQDGSVHYYNGAKLESFSKIRNAKGTTGHQLTANFLRKPLVANGGKIYSLHRANRNLPVALVCEYTCSAGKDATIHSLVTSGSDLLVSWEKDGTYGVDEISVNYANAELITPTFGRARTIKVFYDLLPENTNIKIYTKQDGATIWTEQTVEIDSMDERTVRLAYDLDILNSCQAKVVLNSNDSDCPIIDKIKIV